MGWLKGPEGSTGSLAPAEEDPVRRDRKALGLDGKAGGAAPKRSAPARSGGVALPAWTGGPAGPVGPTFRVAQPGSKTRPGRWGHWDRPFPQYGA